MRKPKTKKHFFNGVRTLFAQRVYAVVAAIPIGKTLSYKEVARRAGRPKAFRAVGSIMNKNHDSRVPCHRVIKSDGTVGGYAHGSLRKLALLKKEKAVL